jgi:hypothetical protein
MKISALLVPLVAFILTPVAGGNPDAAQRWPGGCSLRPTSVANPTATNQTLWSRATASPPIAGQTSSYWLIPHGCAWLAYPPKTPAQTKAPLPGATSIPELRFRIRGRLFTTRIPVSTGALGLEGNPNGAAQTFVVGWPYVYFAACEYDGIQQTAANGPQSIYGHYTVWIFNGRSGYWDAVANDTHRCP